MTTRVYDIKALIQSLTDVPLARQKILGLVKGKLPPDDETVYVAIPYFQSLFLSNLNSANLKLTSGRKFTLVGTAEGQEWKDQPRMFASYPNFMPQEINCCLHILAMEEADMLKGVDMDVACLAWMYQRDSRTRRKISEATQKLNINFMNPLREGKKLLVLDLDYSEWLTLNVNDFYSLFDVTIYFSNC